MIRAVPQAIRALSHEKRGRVDNSDSLKPGCGTGTPAKGLHRSCVPGNDGAMSTTAGTGFSKSVNDYLQKAVTVADAKATAFVAAGVTVGAGVLQIDGSSGLAAVLRVLALGALACSVIVNSIVIFPRFPSQRRGTVFWEDIRSHADMDSYVQAAMKLHDGDIEHEYAAQNYFVSDVLHRKHWWIRHGIVLFLTGVGLGLAAYVMK